MGEGLLAVARPGERSARDGRRARRSPRHAGALPGDHDRHGLGGDPRGALPRALHHGLGLRHGVPVRSRRGRSGSARARDVRVGPVGRRARVRRGGGPWDGGRLPVARRVRAGRRLERGARRVSHRLRGRARASRRGAHAPRHPSRGRRLPDRSRGRGECARARAARRARRRPLSRSALQAVGEALGGPRPSRPGARLHGHERRRPHDPRPAHAPERVRVRGRVRMAAAPRARRAVALRRAPARPRG